MTNEPNVVFQQVLNHVLGQALAAAHYQLEDTPMHHARGLLRYRKQPADNFYTFIEFQNLYHPQSELSRFQINLIRNSQANARAQSDHLAEQTLPFVIWNVYQAEVLPSAEHWWLYKHPQDLAYELYNAGQLLFGYGVPWLEGEASE